MAEHTSQATREGADRGRSEGTRGGNYLTPRVDIYETDDELLLLADVPGVRAEDVDLRFERGELVLHAPVRRECRPEQFYQWEYPEGDFYRAFHIHEPIDGARVEAECKNGVLTVRLPKAEAVRPRQVRVRGE